ncbi:MAG TPA: Omp28-related outer membrane protein [Bacteroidia bacterium]|nr:Omp28-related outer membrane protein [Bacteroidia bacterium]
MKKNIHSLVVFLFLLIAGSAQAQIKKVFLEEHTGAHCGNCPMGSYYADSMSEKYPDLITVALHSYPSPDAMFFPEVDTLGFTYAQGAPLGTVDRICSFSTSTYTAVIFTQWDAKIQTRLAVTPVLTVNVTPQWTAATRNISAQVNVAVLANMPAGDYRVTLYVVEDSVTGTGWGYDQMNFYTSTIGNPFYGLGNPIVGFVHRHVVRAILPATWGLAGIIPAAPTAGQNFTHTFNYILPAGFDENKVSIVAFVNGFTSSHTGDEVFNADEKKLLPGPTGMQGNIPGSALNIYPDPVQDLLSISSPGNTISQIELFNLTGNKILARVVEGNTATVPVSGLPAGLYFVKLIFSNSAFVVKKIQVAR